MCDRLLGQQPKDIGGGDPLLDPEAITLAPSCPLLELLHAHGAHLKGFQRSEAAQGTLTSSVRPHRAALAGA